MQADPDRVGVFEEVPSGKVATTAAYEEHLQYRLQHLPLIEAHFCCKQYQRLRWSTHRNRQSAMMQMCNAIADNQRGTIVGYGDARFNSTGPTVSLRCRLRTYCTVYDVDEFRTSKLCCACHQAMTGMTSSAQGTLAICSSLLHELALAALADINAYVTTVLPMLATNQHLAHFDLLHSILHLHRCSLRS